MEKIIFNDQEFSVRNGRLQIIGKKLDNLDQLKGWEEHPDLKNIDLSRNRLSSIEGIEFLKGLEHLNLRGNKLTDILPLRHLKKLKFLDLSMNKITDITSSFLNFLAFLYKT